MEMIYPVKFRIRKNSSNQYRVTLINKPNSNKLSTMQAVSVSHTRRYPNQDNPVTDEIYAEEDEKPVKLTDIRQNTIAKSMEYIQEMKNFRQTLNEISPFSATNFARTLKRKPKHYKKEYNEIPSLSLVKEKMSPICNRAINQYINERTLVADNASIKTDPSLAEFPPILSQAKKLKIKNKRKNSPYFSYASIKAIGKSKEPIIRKVERMESKIKDTSSHNSPRSQLFPTFNSNLVKVVDVYGGAHKLNKHNQCYINGIKEESPNKTQYNAH